MAGTRGSNPDRARILEQIHTNIFELEGQLYSGPLSEFHRSMYEDDLAKQLRSLKEMGSRRKPRQELPEGVRWDGVRDKWRADASDQLLGYFETIEEASRAVEAAGEVFLCCECKRWLPIEHREDKMANPRGGIDFTCQACSYYIRHESEAETLKAEMVEDMAAATSPEERADIEEEARELIAWHREQMAEYRKSGE